MIPIDPLTALWIEYDLLNCTPSMNDTVQISYSTIDEPDLPRRNPLLDRISRIIPGPFSIPSETASYPSARRSYPFVDEILFPSPVYLVLPEWNELVRVQEPVFAKSRRFGYAKMNDN
jgi:hypothetical protein